MVLLYKLGCFAVCWEFKLCLAIICKLKRGKRVKTFGNIASISQTHHFHKFYIHFSLSTHTPARRHCQAGGFLLVSNYCLKYKKNLFGSVLTIKKRKMAEIWENKVSLSNHNISQNLHRYFTLYGISCW